ncbi:efflux RND transporter periplasmic adaptor subunit [Herbaspirillum huttiense F1]|uniref:Efflux RND transporter periplasmic adaptor subunit n=1 Tax=Herbaspirillum huttiense subsp. lycopersici TaxID=3074428 RepID=A0ABU2ERY6_9BURK|nr:MULTISPECIES: efflux RND transporter periplasmic adaptor subunit [Herbaspirillum]MBP1316568.1 macrolide-specific efflux system membrane fusion protein [Herbaspirillum sp. 1130]MDR6739917.1 macrolide-specific efflux system membrane fusion protein [Herbaspirillum sp. 1173]MDR9850580.1 efflux RND transporter periplasmic adaptor subunit [Herbaspirillum huttiense SE1]MDT0354162.1 efflux RND transporter periplasmic adaptor subunit [Herbaspirillum huttiense F1]MEE1638853.1 efflux RND transporter p
MTEPHDQLPHVVPTTHAPARQKAWWSVVALVLVLGGGYALYARQSPPPAPPKPIPVKLETVAVERADLEQVVNATGNVVAQDYVDVGSKVAGQISDVEVVIGEAVKAGRLLATVAPAVQNSRIESNRATLARLKAELAGQNAQLDFAQLQFQRQTQLKAENATREESYESSRMNMYAAASRVDATNAQIQQTEAAIREDEAVQKQTRIEAPVSGTIVTLNARPGQMVSANQEVLMRIADLSRMTVQVPVSEEDVTRLQKGMTAYFTTPGYPGKRWSGKLRQIMLLPTDDSGRQGKKAYYTVLFDVANPSRELMSGMSADVYFVLARAEHVPAIPRSLVTKPGMDGTQTVKVVLADGTLETRKIKIGIRDGERAQVLSGLKEGEQVLLPANPPAPAGDGNAAAK